MPHLKMQFQYGGEDIDIIKITSNIGVLDGKMVFAKDYVAEDDVRYPGCLYIDFGYKNAKGEIDYVYNKLLIEEKMYDCIDVLNSVVLIEVLKTMNMIEVFRKFNDLGCLDMNIPGQHNIDTQFTPFIDYIKSELYKLASGK